MARVLLIAVLVAIMSTQAWCQFPGSTRGPGNSRAGSQTPVEDTIQRPPLMLKGFSPYNFSVDKTSVDTSIDVVHYTGGYYNISRPRGHLGTETSAKYFVLYDLDHRGLALGGDLFPYLVPDQTKDIIIANRSLWKAQYGRGRDYSGSLINGTTVTSASAEDFSMDFYTSFARNIALNFEYDSHSENGLITQQAISSKRLLLSMLQRSKTGRRSTYVIYDNPRVSEGLSRLNTNESGTLYRQNRKVVIGNSIQLVDSVGMSKMIQQWNTRLSFLDEEYSVSDFSISTDEEDLYPYGTNSETIDTIDFQNQVNRIKLENEVKLDVLQGTLVTGVDFERIRWHQTDTSMNFYTALLRGTFSRLINNQHELGINVRLGMLDAGRDWGIQIDYKTHWLRGDIELKGRAEQLLPTLAQRRLSFGDASAETVSYDFDKIQKLNFKLSYTYPDWKAKIELGIAQYNNLILPSSDGLWNQDNASTSIANITIVKDLNLGPIKTNHEFHFQTWNNDRIFRPDWVYEGKLFFEFPMFKKRMDTRWGVDIYVVPSFSPPNFWPVLGDFGVPSSATSPNNYNFLVNPYLNLKVDQFYIFVKATNVLATFNNQTSYWVEGYPNYPDRIRFGFKWILLD